MGATRYVALLRGINVGGRNPVAMADLRAAFESDGYTEVITYIQSGNVLFETEAPSSSVENAVEAMLQRRLGFPVVVVVRSHRQLRSIVANAPPGFGKAPDTYHSDVVFLKRPLSSKQAMRVVERREGVDQAWAGTGVLYFARVSELRVQSRMSRIANTAEYQRMTLRSWSTTTKLLDLLDARAR